MPYIGIDFGTSNSVVANFQYGQAEVVPNQEGQKWTPSVVTLRRDGTLAFGQEAKENFDEQRSIRSIKRILGTPDRVPFTDRAALTFASEFYGCLVRGLPIGEAVAQARRAVRERHPGDPTWLAYRCFADPGARVGPTNP